MKRNSGASTHYRAQTSRCWQTQCVHRVLLRHKESRECCHECFPSPVAISAILPSCRAIHQWSARHKCTMSHLIMLPAAIHWLCTVLCRLQFNVWIFCCKGTIKVLGGYFDMSFSFSLLAVSRTIAKAGYTLINTFSSSVLRSFSILSICERWILSRWAACLPDQQCVM